MAKWAHHELVQAGMSLWEFRQLLASRRISLHYDETDLDEDVTTLREMGRL